MIRVERMILENLERFSIHSKLTLNERLIFFLINTDYSNRTCNINYNSLKVEIIRSPR